MERFTITVYIKQATKQKAKETRGTEKQAVDITQVNKLELCKLLWYNMGQRKTEAKKGGCGMAEKENGRTEIGAEHGEKNLGNTAFKRDEKGRFVKGTKCGNPNGRPKLPTDAKRTLVSMLPKALATLQSLIDDETVKPDVRLRASEIVIERNLGKAVTPVLTESVGEGSTLTLSEMIACAKELLES
jgi:hypothetical protein